MIHPLYIQCSAVYRDIIIPGQGGAGVDMTLSPPDIPPADDWLLHLVHQRAQESGGGILCKNSV